MFTQLLDHFLLRLTRMGEYMKKIVVSLAITALLSATISAPAFADGWGRHSHGSTAADVLLWPIVAALTLPAAIIGTVAQATLPHAVVYGNPSPIVEGPAAYAGPRAYYAPEPCNPSQAYVEPREYYAPRGYYAARGYYAPRAYYSERGYRTYRGGW